MKPRISRGYATTPYPAGIRCWVCTGGLLQGDGPTPQIAYDKWQEQRRWEAAYAPRGSERTLPTWLERWLGVAS